MSAASARARTAALGLALAAGLAASGAAAADPRLAGRLDAETSRQVEAIVDSARSAGLPADPLVATALEGASKRAAPVRIVAAVRRHARSLADSRAALGPRTSEAELVAGAGALMVGVPRDTLARLRAARPAQSLVIPLVVLADLVAREVPQAAATGAILESVRAGARDGDLMRLRERVEKDIRAGASPAEAAALRARALVGSSSRKVPGAPRPGRSRMEVSSP